MDWLGDLPWAWPHEGKTHTSIGKASQYAQGRRRKPKPNPRQHFSSVTNSISERGLAQNLPEQKGTKYKTILELDTRWRTSSYHRVRGACPNPHVWDCLARGRGRWRTAVLAVNVCLKIIQYTRLKDTFILATNLSMDLLQSFQWFFIEIIRYRSVNVYKNFKTGFLITL